LRMSCNFGESHIDRQALGACIDYNPARTLFADYCGVHGQRI